MVDTAHCAGIHKLGRVSAAIDPQQHSTLQRLVYPPQQVLLIPMDLRAIAVRWLPSVQALYGTTVSSAVIPTDRTYGSGSMTTACPPIHKDPVTTGSLKSLLPGHAAHAH